MTRPAVNLAALREAMRGRGRVLVLFSGGVDSAVLAKVAHDALGDDALALVVDSESYPREEKDAAVRFAQDLGVVHEVAWHSELDDARYAANPVDRCYFCRQGLSEVALRIARARGFDAVAVGTNADDLSDWRPGTRALVENGVWQPYLDLGMTKADVRALARHLALDVADKPSMACLSSRIPYGEPITPDKLTRIGRAESFLRAQGFRQVRVRTLGGAHARIEVLPDEIARLRASMDDVRAHFAALGYARADVDPRGYRTGALHEGLGLTARRPPAPPAAASPTPRRAP